MKSTIDVDYIVLSDVHLGHKRTPTAHIIDNLKATVGPLFKNKLDIIFIAGDLFDRLLDKSMDDVSDIDKWLFWLFYNCQQHSVKLRILEGTPSHDWKQSRHIKTILDISCLSVDFQYISALSIEIMEDLGISILYVPDEWNESTEETLTQVKGLLADNHLNTVDIAIMHGQFAYQIPQAPATIPRHSELDYLSIVKHFIHIGHVHSFSVFERIIAQGSLDRLAHGEEEPKGLVWAHITNNDRSFHFIENKNAMIYKTINLRGSTIEEVLEYLDKKILSLPEGSFIRLNGKEDHIGFSYFREIKTRYLMYTISRKSEEVITNNIVDIGVLNDYQSFSITPDNIEGLLRSTIESKYPFEEKHWGYFKETINSI